MGRGRKLLLATALALAPEAHGFVAPGGLRVSGWQPTGAAARGLAQAHDAPARLQLAGRRRAGTAPKMMLDMDPSVLIAAVTTAAVSAAPAVKGTAASATGAAAAAASPDVIKTLEALQKSVQTLPATVASIPAMKSAIAAASAALAKSGATAQTAVLTKQLAAVSKALSAAAAKAGASVTAATPAPVKAAAASATAAVSPIVKEVAAAIKAISRDTDNDLFNGYPFNAPALVVWASSVVAFSSIAKADNEVPYAAGGYDPVKAEGYFAQRWFLKFGRALQLLSTLGAAPADAPPAPPGPASTLI
jgi:hypothetical protein